MSKLMKISIYVMLFLYLCGSLNYGFTKIYFTLPLIIPIFICAGRNSQLFNISLIITIGGFIVNMTIFYNPLVFPILLNPEFQIKKDCELRIYSDKSSSFYELNKPSNISADKSTKKVFVKKGTRYPIKELFTSGGIDSTNKLYFSTGEFYFAPKDEFIETRLPIENPVLKYAGNVVYFPIIGIVALVSAFEKSN